MGIHVEAEGPHVTISAVGIGSYTTWFAILQDYSSMWALEDGKVEDIKGYLVA